jgi:hypothetical protein
MSGDRSLRMRGIVGSGHVKSQPPTVVGRGLMMVEAAGQLICLFRGRLDYAFTPANLPWCGAYYPDRSRPES